MEAREEEEEAAAAEEVEVEEEVGEEVTAPRKQPVAGVLPGQAEVDAQEMWRSVPLQGGTAVVVVVGKE